MSFIQNIKLSSKGALLLLIIVLFSFWFCYDIITLRQTLVHPDIFTYYYPYRHWFTLNLLEGEFPLWNPFWGLGQPVEAWATIPVDLFTLLELFFGPQYHYFQLFQLIIFLLIIFVVLNRLGFNFYIALTGTFLYFFSPWVHYFFFYYLVINSQIAFVLLFFFTFQWMRNEKPIFLFGIFVTTFFSFFGTKPEFWFYQTATFFILIFSCGFFFGKQNPLTPQKITLFPLLFYILGLGCQFWQIDYIYQTMKLSGRTVSHSLLNIFSSEMHINLFNSILYSPLFHFAAISFLFLVGVNLKKKWMTILSFLIGFTALFFMPTFLMFLKSPYLIGALVACSLKYYSCSPTTLNFRKLLVPFLLFLIYIFYLCRPGAGDLGEMTTIQETPYAFKLILSALLVLGCTHYRTKLFQVAFTFLVIIFLARDQGQIVLSHLTGLIWIPTRDNFIIAWMVALVAILGLQNIQKIFREKFKNVRPHIYRFNSFLPITILLALIFSFAPKFYGTHLLMMPPPPDYPYYRGIPKIRETFKNFYTQDLNRIFIVNKQSLGFSAGLGSSLLEGIGNVTLFSSIGPKNYGDWTIFQRTGINVPDNWGGYPGGYSEETRSRLPKRNTANMSDFELYSYTLIMRPPLEKNLLKLLGVGKITVFMKGLEDKAVHPFDLSDFLTLEALVKKMEPKDISYVPGIYHVQWPQNLSTDKALYAKEKLAVLTLEKPLSRAFLLSNMNTESIEEVMQEQKPVIPTGNQTIKTKHFNIPILPVTIEEYGLEKVRLSTESKSPQNLLVLSDLIHPFWQAKVNGKETPIIPAFEVLRGVFLPEGKTEVEFYLAIPNFMFNIFMSIVSMILAIIIFLLLRKPEIRFTKETPVVK